MPVCCSMRRWWNISLPWSQVSVRRNQPASCRMRGATNGLRRVVSRHRYQDCGSELAFDEGHDRRTLPSSDDQIAFLTVQGVVEARRVLIALLGAAGMASDRPVVSTMSVTAYWEWPPAALLVA